MDKITEKTTPIAVTDKVNEIIDEISLKGAVSSVNGKTPDSSGNVTITAEDTGARPDSWTPTAAEVGAATSGHTHSAATTSAGGSCLPQTKPSSTASPQGPTTMSCRLRGPRSAASKTAETSLSMRTAP